MKVYLNYDIPSLQIALSHCLFKCKKNNNGKKKQKNNNNDLMPYESIMQKIYESDQKSIKSIFLPSPIPNRLKELRETHYNVVIQKQHVILATKQYNAITNMTLIGCLLIRHSSRPGILIILDTGGSHNGAPGTILHAAAGSGQTPQVISRPSTPGLTCSPCKPGWHLALLERSPQR